MIGIGIGPSFAAMQSAPLTELEQILAAIAAGVVDGGAPASTYHLEADGGTPSTTEWEAVCDGGAPFDEQVHYIVGAGRATTYVRGAISELRDIAQAMVLKTTGNANFEYGSAYILAKAAADTVVAYTAGTQLTPGGDDSCPILTYNNPGYLAATHGLAVPTVNSVGHDKTSADIGSVWSDGAHQFVLAEISSDALSFYAVPWTSSGSWYMGTSVAGTLTHVSGATHTTAITVTSQVLAQKYPAVKNLTTTILANGDVELAAEAEGDASFVDFVEEFDLVDPSTLDTNSPWQWNDGDAWMHVKHVYRCFGNATMIHTTYELLREMSQARFGYLQVGAFTAPSHAHQYYYIPKAKPISGYDFAAMQLLDSGPPSILVFSSAYVDDPDNPIDRAVILFEKSGEENYDVALAVGYSPFGDGAAAARVWDDAWGCLRIGTDRKLYPVGQADLGIISSGTWDVHAYRQWVDPALYDHDKLAYWHRVNGHDLVYVDYHRQVTADRVVLPSRLVGKSIQVVDAKACTTEQTVVPASGLLLTTSATHGFIVLELS